MLSKKDKKIYQNGWLTVGGKRQYLLKANKFRLLNSWQSLYILCQVEWINAGDR